MHPFKRGFLVVALSLGAIGGFTHGFAHMAQCHGGGGCAASSRRDEFEDHIADVCTRAAQRQLDQQGAQRGWGGPQWGGPQYGGPQYGGPPPQWGAPPALAAVAPVAPVAPVVVAPAAPAAPIAE